VLEKSRDETHTLDRENLRAQRERYAVGDTEEWSLAVNLKFNVTHWPYIHSAHMSECVQKFFADSHDNLSFSSAYFGLAISSVSFSYIFF
jgi:hypothetical protein